MRLFTHLDMTKDVLEDSDTPETSARVKQIMATAVEIFAQKGYKGTSMREIADACQISKALLYHHFESKETMYERVTNEFGARLHAFVDAEVSSVTEPVEKLRAFMMASAEFFDRNRAGWVASASTFWNDPDRQAQTSRILRRDTFERKLRAIIQDAVDAGQIRADVDVATAGRLVLSTINWLHRWYDPHKGPPARDIVASYFDMIFEGLKQRD